MTIRETQIIACLSCVVFFSCCKISAKDESTVQNVISCEDDIDELLGKIKSGKYIDIFMAGESFDKAIKKLSGENLDRRLRDFEKNIRYQKAFQKIGSRSGGICRGKQVRLLFC